MLTTGQWTARHLPQKHLNTCLPLSAEFGCFLFMGSLPESCCFVSVFVINIIREREREREREKERERGRERRERERERERGE